MTRPPAGVMHECALGYSGWFGVAASSVDHEGSPTVAGFPSVSPARTAVIGRQNVYVYFQVWLAMSASAVATVSSANRRASSHWSKPRPLTIPTCRATGLSCE